MSEPRAGNGRLAQIGRTLTLTVTNAIKCGGLYIAVHEVATQSQPRLGDMAAAVWMMSGAQLTEQALLRLAGRVFGTQPSEHEESEP